MSGFTQVGTSEFFPGSFNFLDRIPVRFIPGRDQISVRLTLGLRALPHASRSLQRTRIREDAGLPWLCQAPPGDPIGYSSPHAPPERSFRVWPLASLAIWPRGVSHATLIRGCYVVVRGPSPAHAGVGVTPDRGFPPQPQLSRPAIGAATRSRSCPPTRQGRRGPTSAPRKGPGRTPTKRYSKLYA